MQTGFRRRIEFVMRYIGAQQVYTVVSEKQGVGAWLKVHADRVTHAFGKGFYLAAICVHADNGGFNTDRVANIARCTQSDVKLVVRTCGQVAPAVVCLVWQFVVNDFTHGLERQG